MGIKERALNSAEVLRIKRSVDFKAFDIYKQNVNYGIIEETQEQHDEISLWYHRCLMLDREAIENVPEVIKPYMG